MFVDVPGTTSQRRLPPVRDSMPERLPPDPGPGYGEIFTRRWVADLILDLVGYTPDRDLGGFSLVEPSCGTGAFLGPVVDRLIASARRHGRDLGTLSSAVRAYDLVHANAELARKSVTKQLADAGMSEEGAGTLAAGWIATGDFLLEAHEPGSADFVVGNPPYVRLESMPRRTMAAYRRQCPTMRGRSDLYVGFLEQGLRLLRPKGVLGYICADRWMRNQYGKGLRELISGSYAVDTVITMHDVDAFEHQVSAYPAIVVVRNDVQGRPAVVRASGGFGENDAADVAAWMRRSAVDPLRSPTVEASRVDRWFEGGDFWPTGTPSRLALVADLEARFPPLQDRRTGTRVGIGVATGCDGVFLTADADLVEEDRLLPLLRAAHTTTGTVAWTGTYLVNPWDEAGLVDLDRHPRLRSYLRANAASLRARHVARQRPSQWYRTIDRVDAELLARPKLVLPDLKAAAHPVLDEGLYYPHHNLYFVVSDAWDLDVLGGLLLSQVANLFVGAYCVRMRGGCYRFQAQYLRRIRVPHPESLRRQDRRALRAAFESRDAEAATAVAVRLYGIDDRTVLGERD